jgi:hypothetical protein
MGTRGFLRLLGSCFPLVLAFLLATVLAVPGGPSFGPARGADPAGSAVSAAALSASTIALSLPTEQAALVADPPAALVTGPPAARRQAAPPIRRSTPALAQVAPAARFASAEQTPAAQFTSAEQSGPAGSAHVYAALPLDTWPAAPVPARATFVVASRVLPDAGLRTPAAPRGPPHLFA